MDGTLLWGYELSNYAIADMVLSPDESYLALVDSNGGNVYKMIISTKVLTSLSVGFQPERVSISPNSLQILVSGWGISSGSFILLGSSLNVIQGVFSLGA